MKTTSVFGVEGLARSSNRKARTLGTDAHLSRRFRMLVLTRKKNESIMIGDDIEIMILSDNLGKVRVGINAPKDLPVHRREVYDAIKRDGRDDKFRT